MSTTYLYLVCVVAALGGFLFGFDTAVISGTVSLVKNDFNLNAVSEGWFVSCALLGCIIGVSFSGKLSDKYGRKIVLIIIGDFVPGIGAGLYAVWLVYSVDYFSPYWRVGYWRGLYGIAIVYIRVFAVTLSRYDGITLPVGFNHWHCAGLFLKCLPG
jgi:MFS family permease